MASEYTKPDNTSAGGGAVDGPKLKNLDQDIRELISSLTSRLISNQRGQKSGTPNQQEIAEEPGFRVVTLTGSNVGATMRGAADSEKARNDHAALPESEDFATYVNSNFQAINNSIMIGGSYETNDPGVHLDISEYVNEGEADGISGRGKKNEKEGSKRDDRKFNDEKTGLV